MRKKTYFFLALIIVSGAVSAQTDFHSTVRVVYDRVVYQHAIVKAIDEEWYRRMKDDMAETLTSQFELVGSSNKTVYKPVTTDAAARRQNIETIIGKNSVYTDFNQGIRIAQRPVFEETFLVTDSLLKIKWMITADTREIAGFTCHKAVGILQDSIGIFAFYTDEIPITGGPESVQGLPGLILGMGVPRLHTTWFASSVQVNNVNTAVIKPETKGKNKKAADVNELLNQFLSRQERWGKAIRYFFSI